MSRDVVSPKVQELIALYRETLRYIEAGHSRDECLKTLELGLRVVYPPNRDADRWLDNQCARCLDTGYEIKERHAPRVGYTARFAVPCVCTKGRKQATALAAYDEAQRTGRGAKRTGWSRA